MTDTQKARRSAAVRRGMEFLRRVSQDPAHFDAYGHDLLFCLDCIASTSRDPGLRAEALALGRERAAEWRRRHASVPEGACARDVVRLVFGSDAADRLGVPGERMRSELRRAAARFGPEDYFRFDPAACGPPPGLADDCPCGAANPRGLRRCEACGGRPRVLGRYGVWTFALVRSYVGERYGVVLGAPHREVLKWRAAMLPYGGRAGGANPDFYWTFYAVTHVVYTLNDYGRRRLAPERLPEEFEFLSRNLREAVELRDAEMMGEFLDTLKAFGLADDDPLIVEGTEFVLAEQHPDGSWGDPAARDIYHRYHSTFTAINGLRDYAWGAD
jgi:hypothetical protein